MRENAYQKRCLAWIKRAYGGRLLAVNIHGGGYTAKGFPDLIVVGGGRAVAFELKGEGSYGLQDDQAIWRRRFSGSGTPHYVIRNDMGEFKRTIRKEFGHETETGD